MILHTKYTKRRLNDSTAHRQPDRRLDWDVATARRVRVLVRVPTARALDEPGARLGRETAYDI